jgi:hypothetical protein
MKIIMVWALRKCQYPGEYGPELLEAMSEYADDDNLAIIGNAFNNASAGTDFVAVQIVEADIDDDKLMEILSAAKVELKNVVSI